MNPKWRTEIMKPIRSSDYKFTIQKDFYPILQNWHSIIISTRI